MWVRNRSISNLEEMLPLAKFALKAHALGDPECRNDARLDLLAGFSGGFVCPPKFPAGLVKMRHKSSRSAGADSSAGMKELFPRWRLTADRWSTRTFYQRFESLEVSA